MLRDALRGRGAPSDNVDAWDVAEVAEERVMESSSPRTRSGSVLVVLVFRVEMFSMTPSISPWLVVLMSSSPRGMISMGVVMMD